MGPNSRPATWWFAWLFCAATAFSAETVVIDPAGAASENDFNALLAREKLTRRDWYAGTVSNAFLSGSSSSSALKEKYEFFYEQPFRWWTHVLDYAMERGGKRFGFRATISPAPAWRSFLLVFRCDRLMDEYHPSYILVNGRRIWDAKVHPRQGSRILVPFSNDDASELRIDFVVDQDYTPDVKGVALRKWFVQLLEPGARVALKGASAMKELSPADKLERCPFGLFPASDGSEGARIDELCEKWRLNSRPDYPLDELWLSPAVFAWPAKGRYHDFLVARGGCNLLGTEDTSSAFGIATSGHFLRIFPHVHGALAKVGDVEATKRILALRPDLEVHWFDGEGSALVPHAGDTESARTARMTENRTKVEEAKKATGAPERVRYISEPFPPALTAAHEYERGADIVVLKNEESPQYNISMAMARGAGRSFGKPFGFCWGQTRFPYPGPDFVLQACLLYYFSGGSWIGSAIDNIPGNTERIPEPALSLAKALRFVMRHPARGCSVVPIGILWTYGDRWWAPYHSFAILNSFQRSFDYDHATGALICEPSFTKIFPWMPQDRAQWNFMTSGHMNYFYGFEKVLRGYDLLDVFLPEYGDALTARVARLLTGTPYGPLDFCYAEKAPVELLKSYGMLAFLGHASLSADLEKKLTAALESGVPVLIGAQHFKDSDGQPVAAFGLKLSAEPAPCSDFAGRVYKADAAGWDTVASAGTTPLVLRRTIGKGALYVYLGEWISEGRVVLQSLLRELARNVAPLRFIPADDQMEYVAYRKGDGAWVALFNHGDIAVGADRLKSPRATPPEPLVSKVRGAWKGEIAFRLDKFGLNPAGDYALYTIEGIDGSEFENVVAGTVSFNLKEIPAEQRDGALHAKVKIGKRAEYVIAPKGQGEAVFFGKP